MYIVIAILIFGILVAIHELGHFLVAKAFGVQVNEFAVGMGPAIFKKKKGETLYALRLLPLGGYCAMEGEDAESENPRAFTSQKAWKRALVLVAGSATHFVLGFLILVVLYSSATLFVTRTVDSTIEGFRYGGEAGIMAGDEILSIDGHRIYNASDFSLYMDRAGETVDMVIRRDGEKLTLDDYPLQRETYVVEGEEVQKYGVNFRTEQANFSNRLSGALTESVDFVRYVWMGLSDLVSGAVGVKDLSGPVGIVSTINEVGENSSSTGEALSNIFYLAAFLAINLAVMNLLPIPALDGGRVFFLLVTALIETITRRHINPKYEGYIHAAGLVLLLALMGVVMVNDIGRLFHG